jgi:sortase (surface protein transpeptidase)
MTRPDVLDPPEDPHLVGWWIASALPGSSQGSTVLVGHVDSAQAGLGAFGPLSAVTPGTTVSLSDGVTSTDYRVTSLQYLEKGTGLPAELFARSGPPRLVLITCGGEFDEDTGSYEENVVVTATPVS